MVINLALIGFALAAVAYTGLSGLLVLRGAPTVAGRLFISALLAQVLWAAVLAAASGGAAIPGVIVGTIEALRLFLWLSFLLTLVRAAGGATAAVAAGTPMPGAAQEARRIANSGIVAATAIAAGAIAIDLFAFGERPAFIVRVIAAVFALVCLEQVYRNTPANGRWAVKFLAVACVAMFGFDLVLYSEALLFSRLNGALWTARGYANALLLPLLAVAAARNQNWKLDIAVSRTVVFHSATLFGVGVFLILMAAGGYWVRYFGGDWGEAVQALVVFAAVVGLLLMLGSGALRARLRVFLAKNFFSYRYDYRAEWLKLTELLSATPGGADEDALEIRALKGLAGLVDSNGGALWLLNDDGQYACTARWRFHAPTPAVSGHEPMVAFLSSQQWIISLPEWRVQPELYQDVALPAALEQSPENWLIVPLLLHAQLLGFATLSLPLTRAEINWEIRDALKTAARQVASYLAVRRAVEALVQAKQFESFNRMSAFVVHDLKNLVAQLTLLLANAARYRDNPEFQQDMLDTVANVVDRMQGLLLQLRAGTRPIEQPSAVPVAQILAAAIQSKRGRTPEPQLIVAPELQHVVVMAHRDRLERVIGHLVQNASEATPRDGKIWVRLSREGERARIDVEDTGKGMSEQFIREHLFKPFQSTKAHGMGIGTFESREYIRELGGSLDVTSSEGKGTVFSMRLPVAVADVPA
ncbi:MAG: PEP-CTERM system histidine kinase PrsK [Burkholderiaceae bacterium]|nr:PEP-CTERM system histidine kinase PrsK [Burkholderiaceae bacterium]